MNIDDDLLMAYADGDLEAGAAAAVAEAVAADPVLAASVARHRAMRREVLGALAPLLAEPSPAGVRRLLDAAVAGAAMDALVARRDVRLAARAGAERRQRRQRLRAVLAGAGAAVAAIALVLLLP